MNKKMYNNNKNKKVRSKWDVNETRLDSELDDDVIEGESALRLYKELMYPTENPERTQLIEESEQMFPNPGKPATIIVELDEEEVKFLESL